jgi:hypothetical protein
MKLDLKKTQYFGGACILAAGLLLKAGAPLVPIVVGIAVAAYLTFRLPRRPPGRVRL